MLVVPNRLMMLVIIILTMTTRDFGEVAVFGHLAVFGGLFRLERLLMRIPAVLSGSATGYGHMCFSELPFGEVRQFEIVEEQVDKFIAAQNEPECILAVAFTRIGGLSSATLTRTRKHVTFDEFLVSGKHHVARAALAAKAGSFIPSSGMLTSPPSRTSLMSRSCEDFLTAP
jgi:hypothetical protein